MKFPYLNTLWDVTPVVVHLTDGLTEDGAPNEAVTYTGACCFSEKAKTLRQPDGTLIQSSASLTIGEDIAPDLPVLTGSVDIGGRTWKIASANRPRNPDGSVHHTELQLN